jgi:hypothetical protein
MRTDNRIVVDLNKVAYAWRGYVTLCGNFKRYRKPEYTVHGQEFVIDNLVYMGDETLLDRAKRLQLLDTWIPYTTLQLSNYHSLTYTGEKAESIWKAWCEKIFNKKGKK